jgi:hypothetical protein
LLNFFLQGKGAAVFGAAAITKWAEESMPGDKKGQ